MLFLNILNTLCLESWKLYGSILRYCRFKFAHIMVPGLAVRQHLKLFLTFKNVFLKNCNNKKGLIFMWGNIWKSLEDLPFKLVQMFCWQRKVDLIRSGYWYSVGLKRFDLCNKFTNWYHKITIRTWFRVIKREW